MYICTNIYSLVSIDVRTFHLYHILCFFTACPTDATVDPTSQKCTCPTDKPGLNDAGDACVGNGTNQSSWLKYIVYVSEML